MYRNLIALLLCLMPMLVIAKQSYPPYPEVWGYDLMDDVNADTTMDFTPIKMGNGDYFFMYDSKPPEGTKRWQVSAVHFFEKTKRTFTTAKEVTNYTDRQMKDGSNTVKQFVELKDGKIIDVTTSNDARDKYKNNNTRLHYKYVYRINDFVADKIIDYEKSIIGIATICEASNKCENMAYPLASALIPLEDDTFIAFDSHYPLLVRFDRDFNTKFKSEHTVKLDKTRELKSNFYVLPYSKVKHFFEYLAKGYTGDYTDDINRQFLDFLFEEEQKGNI